MQVHKGDAGKQKTPSKKKFKMQIVNGLWTKNLKGLKKENQMLWTKAVRNKSILPLESDTNICQLDRGIQ